MLAGILAGVTWALETLILGIALSMAPFVTTEQAIFLAPFVSTFIHDAFSAIWACVYNGVRGKLPALVKALKTKSGKFVILAAVIGGPIGMTGYVLTINNMVLQRYIYFAPCHRLRVSAQALYHFGIQRGIHNTNRKTSNIFNLSQFFS